MDLSKQIARNPDEWLLLVEGGEAVAGGIAHDVLPPDVGLTQKLSKDLNIPFEDPVPLHGDPDVMNIVQEKTPLSKADIIVANAYPLLSDHLSLIAKTGRDFRSVAKEILAEVKGPVSLETVSLTTEGMLKEAHFLADLGANVVVKIPSTTEGLKAIKQLTAEKIKTSLAGA